MTLQEKFDDYHANNPKVYAELVKLAKEWQATGHGKIGMQTLIEKLRWDWNVTTRTALLHCARVYLAQSRHFTSRHRGWSFVLLAWAANKRRQVSALREEPA